MAPACFTSLISSEYSSGIIFSIDKLITLSRKENCVRRCFPLVVCKQEGKVRESAIRNSTDLPLFFMGLKSPHLWFFCSSYYFGCIVFAGLYCSTSLYFKGRCHGNLFNRNISSVLQFPDADGSSRFKLNNGIGSLVSNSEFRRIVSTSNRSRFSLHRRQRCGE